MWRLTVLPTASVLCTLCGGCATQGPQPTEELARARTLIEQADKSQAQRYAAPDLQRARDELSSAELANTKRDYNAARSYAESAAADADVATARASAGEALRAANEVRQANRALEQESERANQAGAPPPRSDLQGYPAVPPGPAAPPPPDSAPPEPQAQPQ